MAHQAPLSMGFSRQEYRSGWPCLSPGDLPDPGIEPVSPALAGGFFTTEPPGKPPSCIRTIFKKQKRRDLLGGPVVKSPVQGDTGTIAVWAS